MSDDNIKKIFSKKLCYFLDLYNKNQADLSKYMGVSSATVSDWCNAKKLPRMDKIQSICNWLNIEKSDLLEDKEPLSNGENIIKKYLANNTQETIEFLMLLETASPEARQTARQVLKLGQLKF